MNTSDFLFLSNTLTSVEFLYKSLKYTKFCHTSFIPCVLTKINLAGEVHRPSIEFGE
jgi:hypothetical protein